MLFPLCFGIEPLASDETRPRSMPLQAPYYPIVYVRGYAGSRGEVEATVADPYMGFNLGSMKVRQRWTGACSGM
ncbi:MAG: hypothetical protein U5P41_00315 [Gammaproteobacteria bacterium]|nr:hypothetical protein [Gammaproteobacteria bacterium]